MPNQQMTPGDPMRSTRNWWLFLAQVGAVSVEVFLHNRFGERYCRLAAAAVLPLVGIYAWLWEMSGYDVEPVVRFLTAYMVALLFSQACVLLRLRRGDQEHSYYNGFPWLLPKRNAHGEIRFKQWGEPLLVLGLGLLMYEHSRPLGAYLMFAAGALFLCNASMGLWRRRQIIDMQDAVFIQRQTAGGFQALQTE